MTVVYSNQIICPYNHRVWGCDTQNIGRCRSRRNCSPKQVANDVWRMNKHDTSRCKYLSRKEAESAFCRYCLASGNQLLWRGREIPAIFLSFLGSISTCSLTVSTFYYHSHRWVAGFWQAGCLHSGCDGGAPRIRFWIHLGQTRSYRYKLSRH